ncbi:MAG: magnesium/cobalt transporter CorA [Wenzhouxiangellaceae bacterium]|nr:magnesium/cobalt transporter CorA [Wenzhouxiangellaceae bacterium]MBS3745657.1 magnesium/cobalt transporter CorA [Wenzhouxiangellaceae bacterium]MBS3822443.1 magnesium/cobalt transporter CorA [Wenzhouxiangellaceae bacterium]
MIGYRLSNERLVTVEQPMEQLDHLVWIDLYDAPLDEVRTLEDLLGVNIPTRDEMEEIEVSSRLYEENDAWFLTVTLPARAGEGEAEMGPVSFVLTDWLLITVRSTEPRAFRTFPQRAARADLGLESASAVLLTLLEAIVDRLADILEHASREIDAISSAIFAQAELKPSGKSSFQDVLQQLGRQGDLLSDLRESLMTLSRAGGYLGLVWPRMEHTSKESRDRLQTLSRDVQSISEHASFMTQKVTFLLDATLGMINIEQNATIKIFSVLAVIFMPPTMIASIYGMNFEHMPELTWPFGYPAALAVMLGAAILPYWFFKRKGWL